MTSPEQLTSTESSHEQLVRDCFGSFKITILLLLRRHISQFYTTD